VTSTTSDRYEAPEHGWRTFVVVWASQSLSVFGTSLTLFAVTIWLAQVVYGDPAQRQSLSLSLSVVALCTGVPLVLTAPFAGTWVDRHDRRRTMVLMDFVNGLVSLALALAIAAGAHSIWIVAGLLVVQSTASAFHVAAFDASYRMLVPEHRLGRANGMTQMMWSAANIVAPGIAALLVSVPLLARQSAIGGPVGAWLGRLHDGAGLAIGVDAVTFFAMAAVLLGVSIPSPRRADLEGRSRGSRSFWADMRTGAAFLGSRPALLWLLAMFTIANLVGSARLVFLPLLVQLDLHADWSARGLTFQAALAVLTTMLSIGGVAGGVCMTVWGGLKSDRVLGIIVPMIVSGAAQLVLGLSTALALAAAAALVTSAMIPVLNSHSQTIWQIQTPREMQGRVFSTRRVIAQITGPVGILIAGVAGGLVDPGRVLAALGAVLALFATAQLFNGPLRRVENPGLEPGPASRHLSEET
jgi:MFS family permease